MCILRINPFCLPVDILHDQYPYRFFNQRDSSSAVVAKLRHRDATLQLFCIQQDRTLPSTTWYNINASNATRRSTFYEEEIKQRETPLTGEQKKTENQTDRKRGEKRCVPYCCCTSVISNELIIHCTKTFYTPATALCVRVLSLAMKKLHSSA